MNQPLAPIVQRSCALCGVVDDGPRNEIRLASGQVAFYHLDNNGDGVSDCPTERADPHPEIDETPDLSQLRRALENDPGSITPDPTKPLSMASVDAQAGPEATTLIKQTGEQTWELDVTDADQAQAAADVLHAGRGCEEMPLTAECAIRLLKQEFDNATPPTWSQTRMSLVTNTSGSQAPTATAPGNAITGDPRVAIPAWDPGATAINVSAIKNVGAFQFTNMPDVPSPGVTHFNLWNSGGTPVRRAYGQMGAARVTVTGDTLTFADGSTSVGLVTTPGATESR